MANVVTVSGMFGDGHTYFADSPVVIDISGLQWPGTSPFNIVRVEVVYKRPKSGGGYDMVMVGDFHEDTGGQPTARFNISTALKTIWGDYEYTDEVTKAQAALTANVGQSAEREMREYILRIYTEYLLNDDGGVFTVTQCAVEIDGVQYTDIPGGQCLMGGMTEWERSLITDDADRDVSHFEHTGVRNGDASTKPTSTPERVGIDSITSWVDVKEDGTKSIFYPADTTPGDDDVAGSQQGWTGHTPIVIRDSVAYIDFLFINRRGAIETCSGMTKEQLGINTDVKQYSRTDGPTFRPTRSLMAIGTDGRRSWQMSSGYVTREWADWWTMEFLGGKRKQWWMLYKGRYVPVTVKAAKSDTVIYDKTKQQMPHVDFTVTLALEG
jgi:hypothetical protein